MKKILIVSSIIMVLLCGCSLPYGNNTTSTTQIQNNTTQESGSSTNVSTSVPENIVLFLDITNDANLVFAKYNINIYLDGTLVGTVKNGDVFTKQMDIAVGKHALKFMSASDTKIYSENEFTISKDSTLKCKLKAHEAKIEIMKGEIIDGLQGAEIDMPDVLGQMLPDAKKSLQALDLKKITTKTNTGESIVMDSNWIVIEQSINVGDTIDKGTEIVLTCGRISDFVGKYISDSNVRNVVDAANKYGFTVEFVDESNGQAINFQNGINTYEDWMVSGYEASSVSKKTVKIKLMYLGLAEVPSVVGLTAEKAKTKLLEAHFPYVVFEDENNVTVENESGWTVVEQSVEPLESISTSTTIRLKVKRYKTFKDISFEVPNNWTYKEETNKATLASESDHTLLRIGYNLYNGKEDLTKSVVEKIVKGTASKNDELKNLSTTKTTIGNGSISCYVCKHDLISGGTKYKNVAYVFKANGDLYLAYFVCLDEEKYDEFLETVKKITDSMLVNASKYVIVENNEYLAELVTLDRSKSATRIKELVDKLKNKTIKIHLVVRDCEKIKGTRFKYTFVPLNSGKINKNGPLFYFSDVGYIDFRFKSGNGPESLSINTCITCYIKISEYKDGRIYVSLDHDEHSEYVGEFK